MVNKIISAIVLLLMSWLPKIDKAPEIVIKTNPNYISSLQERTYAANITREKLVVSTGQYDSYLVSFISDNIKEYGLLNIPKGKIPDGGWPVLMLNHGHIDPKVYSTTSSYVVPAADFARAGFVVLKPDYRGHGNSQGSAEGILNRIGYSVDVLNLLAGAKKLPDINPNRMYMWGHSMGGDVTLRALEICGQCVKAASLWAPAVTTWPENTLYFVRKGGDNKRAASMEAELKANFAPEEYSNISAFDNINLVKVPMNLHQGTADESVPYAWGQALANKFTELGIKYTFFSYPGDDHNIRANWSTAIERDVKLFNEVK